MKTRILIYIILLFVLAGCKKPNETIEDDANFCSCLNTESMDKTIPFVNEFLAAQPSDWTVGKKLETLAAWLKNQPCILDAAANPPSNEILISFDEEGAVQKHVLEFAKNTPFLATGYRVFVDPKEVFCSYLNAEKKDKILLLIDEILEGLSNDLDDEQNMQTLLTWLKEHDCIKDATVFGEIGKTKTEIVISLDENGTTKNGTAKDFILEVSMNYPMKATAYREYLEEEFCAYFNMEDMDKTIPFINLFLSRLSDNLTTKQKNQALVEWLNSKTCIKDANVLGYYYVPPDWLMLNAFTLSFGENEKIILEISSLKQPLKVIGYSEYLDDSDFCPSDVANPQRSIPVINKFLAGLSNDLTGKQKMEELEKWLNLQPCLYGSSIICYSTIKTDPPTGEIGISHRDWDDNLPSGFRMDVLWSQPMIVTGFHHMWYQHDDMVEPIVPSQESWIFNNEYRYPFCQQEQSMNKIQLFIINNNEELENYICDAVSLPSIDFSKKTLLIAQGLNSSGGIRSGYLHQFASAYVLYVDVLSNSVISNLKNWMIAIVTDKLDEDMPIESYINFLYN